MRKKTTTAKKSSDLKDVTAHITSRPPNLEIAFRPSYMPKLLPCTWMEESGRGEKDFFYFNDQKAYLALVSKIRDYGSAPVWTNPDQWVKISHQTAGYACNEHQVYAHFLKPKDQVKPLLDLILELYNDSCISSPPTLDVAQGYESLINKFGLTANFNYQDLEEGYYPIDIECLSKVTNEKFPKDLKSLTVAPKKGEKSWSFLNWRHYSIAILGPNCD